MARGTRGSDAPAHRLSLLTAPRFLRATCESGLRFDEAQRAAIERIARPAAHGVYLWGSVGRGKTRLAEIYFEALPTRNKRRFHFHGFFRRLQSEIALHGRPLQQSIDRVLAGATAVLFDEFHVHDVADAVFLTRTLQELLDRDTLLILTSNYAPSELLPNPLFHDRFLPAIRLIETRLEIVPLGDGPDYRRLGEAARADGGFSAGSWTVDRSACADPPPSDVGIDLDGIPLRALAANGESVAFAFEELCDRPLGAAQYLQLAERFDAFSLHAVPDLAEVERDALLRLCILVDVLADADRRLDITSAAAPERMLEAASPPHDAARTLSRLALLRR